jgi:hypothetical protein
MCESISKKEYMCESISKEYMCESKSKIEYMCESESRKEYSATVGDPITHAVIFAGSAYTVCMAKGGNANACTNNNGPSCANIHTQTFSSW